jgi:Ribbon-helix-helix protein, copG family
MTIRKPPAKKEVDQALAAFVDAAPDAAASSKIAAVQVAKPAGTGKRGRPAATETMIQITVKFSSDDLEKLDAAAAKRRITRAALIRQAVFAAIE